jgi:hypothetical protein
VDWVKQQSECVGDSSLVESWVSTTWKMLIGFRSQGLFLRGRLNHGENNLGSLVKFAQ